MLGQTVLQKASRAMSNELHRRSRTRRLTIRKLVWVTRIAALGASQNIDRGRRSEVWNSQKAHHTSTSATRNA
jgi:hypothetical protein